MFELVQANQSSPEYNNGSHHEEKHPIHGRKKSTSATEFFIQGKE